MRVNCNISAIIANNQLGKSENSLSQAIERLSSGLKINHAKDDASGMAISKKMHAQIKALGQSSKNTQDGVSVVQTAESALGEIENMLQRMRELAVQAASDTNGIVDREALQAEIDQLAKEVDRISNDTEYNTMPLLDGTLSRRAYTDADNVEVYSMSDTVTTGEYTFSITSAATRATYSFNDFTAATEAGSITINGASVSFEAGESKASIVGKLQNAADIGNTVFEASATGMSVTNKLYGSNEKLNITFSSENIATMFTGSASTTVSTEGKDCEATLGAGFSPTANVVTSGNIVTVKDVNSFEIQIEAFDDAVHNDITVKVTELGVMGIQAGANEGQQINIDIPKVNMHTLGLDYINLRTGEHAGFAITKFDKAINTISSIRSKLGAFQNRLETTTKGLDEYEENITAGLSRIEDCDMAEEMTTFTAHNVKTQAATSILAQANERPESVLQLLQ